MGILSGLIGITAGCDNFKIYISCIVGITSAFVYKLFKSIL